MRPVLKTLLNNTLRARAIRCGGGSLPDYYFDFVNNRALIAGRDIGPISNTPSLTGTLDLTSRGHLVDGADNGIVIPVSGVTYPLMVVVELVRNTDTGAAEVAFTLDNGTTTENLNVRFTASDNLNLLTTATSLQASVAAISGVTVPSSVLRIAGRVSTNDIQVAGSPLGTLGTQDTSNTNPANPTHMRVGTDLAGAHTFTGLIREIAIVSNITSTNGQLVAAALAA